MVRTVDTVVVVTVPGMGDDIQAIKAGILEIADVFVVNKADRDGVDRTVRDLEMMLSLGEHGAWIPPILKTVAAREEGIDLLLDAIESHREFLRASGEIERRRLSTCGCGWRPSSRSGWWRRRIACWESTARSSGVTKSDWILTAWRTGCSPVYWREPAKPRRPSAPPA